MVDVFSRIGGITATLKVFLATVGPFYAFKFMVIFARVLKRKSAQKVRIFRIKDIKKAIKVIIPKIEEKIALNKEKPDLVKECREELEIIKKDG